jgi:hypothetical protein
MIVVSNTSPLTNLAAIGQFGLLQRLYGEIIISEAVWAELNAYGKAWPGRMEVETSPWIHRKPIQERALVTALRRDLDAGEAESIALALDLRADLLLLDEMEGRHAAQRLGLRVLGVVGVLLQAKSRGEIERVKPYLNALRQTAGFYLSDAVLQAAVEQAGEA